MWTSKVLAIELAIGLARSLAFARGTQAFC